MFSRAELADNFRRLGLEPGDTVMLHASVRSIGPIAGGPDQIHLALMDAISPGDTILMYASCPRYYDEVGRGNLTLEEEQEVLSKLPPFDPFTDRAAQDNGVLAEFFRTYPGTIPSRNIARIVARGELAESIVAGQLVDFPLGAGSPFEVFTQLLGKIVLLGSCLSNVTYLHYVEHVTDFPNKKVLHLKVPMLVDGQTTWIDAREVDSNGAHANWPDDFFECIVRSFLESTGNAGRHVGNALTYMLDADALAAYAAPIMIQVANGAPPVYHVFTH